MLEQVVVLENVSFVLLYNKTHVRYGSSAIKPWHAIMHDSNVKNCGNYGISVRYGVTHWLCGNTTWRCAGMHRPGQA